MIEIVESGDLASLPRLAADLAILCEIGEVLNSAVDLDEVLNMILTGVTAGQGLRFNRAFLLLVDEVEQCLKGELAVGPDDAEHAARVWAELAGESRSVGEVLLANSRESPGAGGSVSLIVSSFRVPLHDDGNLLVRALREGGARVVRRGDGGASSGEEVAARLGVDAFALVPIRSRGGPIGVLLADNAITARPIDQSDVDMLHVFADYAGTAIEKARLYARIREEKRQVEAAHEEMKRSQQTILNLQRLCDLGEMAARVAHEIRNPLVTIGGFARLMLAGAPADDARRRHLEIIVKEVARLEVILSEVLEYARPLTVNAARVDLNDLVRETTDMLAFECQTSGIEVGLDLDTALPEILADPGLLRIALLNLCRNALQAVAVGSEGGGGSAAPRGRITIRTRGGPAGATLSVLDNGPGIPADAREHIFEPFFTTKTHGSGLGLAIVSQIVKEHGGRIRFESRPGAGTAFAVELPLKQGGGS